MVGRWIKLWRKIPGTQIGIRNGCEVANQSDFEQACILTEYLGANLVTPGDQEQLRIRQGDTA